MSDYAIKVENLSKDFKLPHNKKTSLKEAAISLVKRDTSYEVQHALHDVSFEIKQGEFFGIVGRNGSGKSTLLKIMAGVYTPTSGGVRINGSLVPFIELGVGFNPELSGRDNVFLNGALLGFSREEMLEMYDEIVEFAELENFMDQKLKNYSSGMQVRLAFSIAIRAEGEILLLDEVLAVGDAAFQKKCLNYFENLKLNKQTVVLVTHSMETIERYCDRAAFINKGVLEGVGDPDDIAQQYRDINVEKSTKKKKNESEDERERDDRYGVVVDARVLDENNKPTDTLNADQPLRLSLDIESKSNIPDPSLGLIISNSNKTPLFAYNSHKNGDVIEIKKGKINISMEVDNIFANDIFSIKISLKDKENTKLYFHDAEAVGFRSIGRNHSFALTYPKYSFKINKD